MSAKKYKGLLCVYCSERQSTVGDHVFAREFFALTARANLPQVPTCERCNNEKSKLEHYLTTVLPFGGRHKDSHTTLSTLVPPRLAKNLRLHRGLNADRSSVWAFDEGLYRRAMAVPVDPVSVESLFALVARALVWHHWKAYFTNDHEAQVLMLTRAGSEFFASRFFSMASANRVQESLGNDTVSYEGIQGIDLPQISVWRFKFYGGISFAGDPRAPGESSTEIGVVTGPKRILKPSLTASGFRITR